MGHYDTMEALAEGKRLKKLAEELKTSIENINPVELAEQFEFLRKVLRDLEKAPLAFQQHKDLRKCSDALRDLIC